MFVCESYLFFASCTCWVMEKRNRQSIIRVVRYECDEYFKLWIWVKRFHDIEISKNAYKYQKLWVWFDSNHLFDYSLLIANVYKPKKNFKILRLQKANRILLLLKPWLNVYNLTTGRTFNTTTLALKLFILNRYIT